jgi:hypothetical protein
MPTINLNFSNVDGSCMDGPNAPGLNSIYCVRKRGIVGNFPKVVVNDDGSLDFENCDFDENFVLKSLPTLSATVKLAEYEFPDGTASADFSASGDNGYNNYTHSLDFALAGLSRVVKRETYKHLNAGSVWFTRMNGTQLVMVGASYSPVYLKTDWKSGKAGKDKRGFTLKGNADGMMFPPLEVPDSLMADFAALLQA